MPFHVRLVAALGISVIAIVACAETPKPVPTSPTTPLAESAAHAPSSSPAAAGSTSTTSTPKAPAVTTEVLPPVVAKAVTPRKPSGKTAKFKWSQGMCDHTGTFDMGRFSAAELTATVKLFQTEYVPTLDERSTRAAIDKEFHAAFDELKALEIVPEPAWETFRATKLTQYQQRYQLAASEVELRKDPTRLLANPSYPVCRRWADPLIAGDDATLVASWKALATELTAKPGASAAWREVDAQSKQPGAVVRARADLLSFGWHNCVNDQTVPLPFQEDGLDKLFVKQTHDCDR